MFALSDLMAFLKNEGLVEDIDIPKDMDIKGFSPISDSKQGTISWTRRPDINWSLVESSVVICAIGTNPGVAPGRLLLCVENPRSTFIRIMEKFWSPPIKAGIADTAMIGNNCDIGTGVYIGHHTVIGDDVIIGDDTVIHSLVSIYANVRIGSRCSIHSGSVIGSDGFGYERENGEVLKFPHIGGVIIGDDVEIGSNTCIDRGTLGDTTIENGAKIDNLCHIAHNVRIEENAFVIACSMIGGSARIAKNSWIAPGAIIRDGLVIGEGAMVGLGAVVVKDVTAGDVVTGIPAQSIKNKEKDV